MRRLQINIFFVLFITLLFPSLWVYSQTNQYKFRHITPKEGLSSHNVFCITKDSNGFMWFGTKDGLNRFDGYNIKVYKHIQDDSTTLSDNIVLSVLELDPGHLLVGTLSGGLNIFNRATGRFTHYINNPAIQTSLSQNRVNAIYRDNKGLIWIGTNDGLNLFDPESGKFKVFKQNQDTMQNMHNQMLSLFKDSDGNFWIGTNSGLYLFDYRVSNFHPVVLDPPYDFNTPSFIINCINEDPFGEIWIGTNRGLFKYNDGHPEYIGPSNTISINRLIEDIEMVSLNNLHYAWISTHAGLLKYNFQTDSFTSFYSVPGNPESISNQATMDLLYDNTGLLWIVTRNMGIDLLSMNKSPFHQHLIEDESWGSFKFSASEFFEDSDGNIWIGSHAAGLLKYDQNLKRVSTFINLKFSDGTEYTNGRVKKIVQDSDGILWIGMSNPKPSICIFEETTGKFQIIPFNSAIKHDPEKQPPKYINDMIEDHQGNILLGYQSGLYWIPKDEKPNFLICPFNNKILSSTNINDLYRDKSDLIWVSSEKDLYSFKPDNSNSILLTKYYAADEDKSVLPNCVFQDVNRQIWVGTNQGLFLIIEAEKKFYPVEKNNELIYGNQINAITQDNNKNLWLATEKGLVRYNTDQNKINDIKLFETIDGLPYSGSVSAPLFKRKSGEIFVTSKYGTQNGFYCFHPGSINVNTHIPKVLITEFKVRNDPFVLDSNINNIRHIYLQHDENYFSFEFAALDYINPEKNQYAYKLGGIDKDWIYSGNRRFVNYTGIPPGNYTFLVKGSNNDGYWNKEGANVIITIFSPPWKTWWAYSLYLIGLFLILFYIVRFYIRRQRLLHKLELEQIQIEKLAELDKMKSRFFANISHEFRTPLTLILGPLDKFKKVISGNVKKDVEMMERNARRLQRLINQLLSLSKLESGKMKLQTVEVNLVKVIKGYVQAFESLAYQRNIDLKFESKETDIQAYVDQEKLEKILYNLLSNAFKFIMDGGKIIIEIHNLSKASQSSKDNYARITISDTGQGIHPDKLDNIFDRFYQADDSYTRSQEGTGIGLALTKELIELHHGQISVESEVNKGTTFNLFFPLGKKHLKKEEISDTRENIEFTTEISNVETFVAKESVERIDKTKGEDLDSNSSIINPDLYPLILIIEDNADLRSYVRDHFDESYHVIEASDGVEGFEKAIENVPDLIISDVMMPKMDGYELCKKLKTNEPTSHIPVILLTARASKESKIEGLETGADDFIIKPFDSEELLVRVRNIFEQRKKLSKLLEERLQKGKLTNQYILEDSSITSMDEQFLKKVFETVNEYYSDPEFNVETFSQKMAISRVHLHRKLKALIDLTVSEFLRTYRLNKAAEKLAHKEASVSEIAYDVGFSTVQYFSKCFLEQFGVSPSAYSDKHKLNHG